MHSSILDDNSEEDRDSQDRNLNNNVTANLHPASLTNLNSSSSAGYYDAEKCRAYIANQIKVSKIDRFAAQVSKALEVEAGIQSRLGNILNMYIKRSAQVTHEFAFRCKMGLQRHRQDRILNQQRKPIGGKMAEARYSGNKRYSISTDLLYGPGAHLVHSLLTQSIAYSSKSVGKKRQPVSHQEEKFEAAPTAIERSVGGLSEDDYLMSDQFEPNKFVKNLEELIRGNAKKSQAICGELNKIRQLFERLASEHRDKVDVVYAAEEGRQAATVIRRSAYNLSMAAIKATSTPVHVNSNNEIS